MLSLLLQDTYFAVRGVRILKKLSLHIPETSFTYVHGQNGSGKSILLQCLAGKHHYSTGSFVIQNQGQFVQKLDYYHSLQLVQFSDHKLTRASESEFYQQRFHATFSDQGPSISDYLQLQPNQLLAPTVMELLTLSGLDHLLDSQLLKLSNGQRRKLLLVKAMSAEPKLLFLDDLYVGLDPKACEDLSNWITEVGTRYGTQFVVTGRQPDVPSGATFEIEIIDQAIHYTGLPLANKVSTDTTGAQHITPVPGETQINHELYDYSEPAVQLQKVTVGFDSFKLLDDVDLMVSKGEKVAIVGENGSGKSTLLNLIYGDIPQSYAYPITLFGKARGPKQNIWDIKKRIGYVSADLAYYFPTTYLVHDVISSGYTANLSRNANLTSHQKKSIKLYLHYFSLDHRIDDRFMTLSSGQQQVVLLIRGLVNQTAMLLLDEPFQNMDDQQVDRSHRILNNVRYRLHSFLLITHHAARMPSCIQSFYQLQDGRLSPA